MKGKKPNNKPCVRCYLVFFGSNREGRNNKVFYVIFVRSTTIAYQLEPAPPPPDLPPLFRVGAGLLFLLFGTLELPPLLLRAIEAEWERALLPRVVDGLEEGRADELDAPLGLGGLST